MREGGGEDGFLDCGEGAWGRGVVVRVVGSCGGEGDGSMGKGLACETGEEGFACHGGGICDD